LRKALPETLAMHALYCLESDNKLLIYTDSQVWATQLRFRGKPLIEAAQPLCRKRIEVVQVRLVKPWGVSSERYVRTATLPSRQSIAAIRAGATGNSDGVLQLALLKLTATLERLSGEKPDNPE
ncbi:MAG: DciA family protein, partial [Gammaproteobacteria bacterium]